MTSYYLTQEASARRIAGLIERVASEAVEVWPGLWTFMSDCDFWSLPPDVKQQVVARVRYNSFFVSQPGMVLPFSSYSRPLNPS